MPDLTEITVDNIVQDWGDYYKDNGQNMANLHTLPFDIFETMSAFTVIQSDDTVLRESNVEFAEILQQYQDEFTPKGGVTFKPRDIPLFQMKIDQEFNPKKLQRSWLSFLTNKSNDPADYPFVKWFIEVYLMNQYKQDMEEQAIYKGVFEDPQPGVPGQASKVMDGVEKWINYFIASENLAPITLGTPSTNAVTFVGQVESFAKGIPEKYRNMSMEINMSRTLRDRFKEGMRTKYNMNYQQVGSLVTLIDNENLSVVGRPSMMGKNKLWCTPKYNALMGVKGFSSAEAFKVESAKRMVSIFSDWFAGVGFITPKLLFVSDGDL